MYTHIHICKYTYVYIYIYIYTYVHVLRPESLCALLQKPQQGARQVRSLQLVRGARPQRPSGVRGCGVWGCGV